MRVPIPRKVVYYSYHMHQRPSTIEHVDIDEHKLAEIHKHSFGIIIIYLQSFLGMLAAAVLIFFVAPSLIEDKGVAYLISGSFLAVAGLLAFLVMAISTYIYRQNRIIVTDRNITQILQYGLFSRKISQLNIVNVEDVTSIQHGLIPTLFNYGVLKIETAGEQENFHFAYCPNSGYVAKVILEAREKMLGQQDAQTGSGASAQRARRSLPSDNRDDNHPVRMRGIGAEVIERAHEPPDKN
jgi:uncharacterized membrane protein YdbT with pleckstrin-like domain